MIDFFAKKKKNLASSSTSAAAIGKIPKKERKKKPFSMRLCVVVAIAMFQHVEKREAVGTAFVIIEKKNNFFFIN